MFERRIEFGVIALWVIWGSLVGLGGSKSPGQAQTSSQDGTVSSTATTTTASPPRTYADSVGTGNRIEIFPETQDASSGPYVRHLLAQLKKSWLAFIPDEARDGAPAKVTVVFEILPDGKLPKGDPQIESGSGVASLDKAAIYAIHYWHQYDPLPTGFQEPTLKLRINFLYNVHTTTPIEIAPGTVPQTAPSSTDRLLSTGDGNGVSILSDTQGVNFTPYLRQMLKLLQKNWEAIMPEEVKMGEKGKVTVTLEILPDGTLAIGDPQIEKSSDVKVLDKIAVNAIRNSVPFKSLPQQFHGPFLKLRILFLYNINPSAAEVKPVIRKE